MNTNKRKRFLVGALIIICLFSASYLLYAGGRPVPIPKTDELFTGAVYHRVVRYLPRLMVAHIMVVDTRTEGLRFLVTPPDTKLKTPLFARKTSKFLSEFDVQIAINGDGFAPWWSNNPWDYYPHTGDPVTPLGLTASRGKVYAYDSVEDVGLEPTLYFGRKNDLTFNIQPKRFLNAISGDRMLVFKGEPVVGLDNDDLDPRTAVGRDKSGRYLVLVIVDGRQPFYSNGTTLAGLADLLIEYGVYEGMNLDGGGSSTLVIEGAGDKPVVLNSPIDNYIPGRERPVANHLGIYLPK